MNCAICNQPIEAHKKFCDQCILAEANRQQSFAAPAGLAAIDALQRVLISFGDEIQGAPKVEPMALDFVGTGSWKDGERDARNFERDVIQPCRDALKSLQAATPELSDPAHRTGRLQTETRKPGSLK